MKVPSRNLDQLVSEIAPTPQGQNIEVSIYAYGDGHFQITGTAGPGWVTTENPYDALAKIGYLLHELDKRATRQKRLSARAKKAAKTRARTRQAA